jgi:hypothetical protein
MIAARTIENWLALFAARCFSFISLSALWRFGLFAGRRISSSAQSKQSHYKSRVHEVGLHILQNEGEFELV